MFEPPPHPCSLGEINRLLCGLAKPMTSNGASTAFTRTPQRDNSILSMALFSLNETGNCQLR